MALFEYLREFKKLRTPIIKQISYYEWKMDAAEIMELAEKSDDIQIYFRDSFADEHDEESLNDSDTVLNVVKPGFVICPSPKFVI